MLAFILDYNFLLLWYFLILEVNNKKGYFIINFNKIASVLTVVNIFSMPYF